MNNKLFDEMYLRAQNDPHMARSGKHGLRVLSVFEDRSGVETMIVPADGKGQLHFYVINGSHRNLAVTLESRVVFGAMSFVPPDRCKLKVPALAKDRGKPREMIPLEGILTVEKSSIAEAPQEIFLTRPHVEKIEEKPSEVSGTAWDEMRNIVYFSPQGQPASVNPTGGPPPPQTEPTATTERLKKSPLILNGSRRKRLHQWIIRTCLYRTELEMIVNFELEEDLNNITGDGSLKDVVFQLIKWAEAKDRMDDLIEAVSKYAADIPDFDSEE